MNIFEWIAKKNGIHAHTAQQHKNGRKVYIPKNVNRLDCDCDNVDNKKNYLICLCTLYELA